MSDSDPTGEKPHPHHWGRRLLIGGAALVVVLGLLTALAPTLISTGPGTRAVVAIANRSLRGTLAIDDLDAGWFSPTRLKGVTLTGEDGQIIVSVRELALQDKSVAGLIRSVEDLGRVTGDTIGVNLVRYDDGSTNLQRALPQPQPDDDRNKPDEPAEPLAYHTDIQLSNIVFSLASPGTDPVTVNAPKVNLKLAGQSRLDLDVDATLTQRQHVGRITAVGELREWTTPARSADLTAQLQAVPVAVLDHLLGYDRRLVALLGQQIDGELVVQGTQESALLHLTARSPRASVELPLRLSTAALTSDTGGHLLLTVTPEAYAAWTVAPTSGELLAPVTLAISLGELRLPMEDGSPLPAQLRAALDVNADALRLRHPQLGDLTLTSLSGSAKVDMAGGAIDASLAGPFTLNEQPGSLDARAAVAGLGDGQSLSLDATLNDLPVPIVDQLTQQNGRLVALVGQRLTVAAKGEYPGDLDVSLRSDHTQLDAPLSISQQAYALRAPAEARVTLSPAAYRGFAGDAGGTLQQPVHVTLTVNEAHLPLAEGKVDATQLRIDAAMTTSAVAVDRPDVGLVRLDPMAGTVGYDRAADLLKLALGPAGAPNPQAVALGVAGEVSGLASRVRRVKLDVTNVPVPLIDALTAQNGRAVALVGRTAALRVEGDYPGDLTAALTSDTLQVNAPLSITPRAYALSGPATLRLALSPAAYALLAGESGGTLLQPATIDATINELTVPIADDAGPTASLRVDGGVRSSTLALDVPAVGRVQLDALDGRFNVDRRGDTLAFSMASPMSINGEAGRLDARGNVTGLTAATRRVDATLVDVPVPVVDPLLGMGGRLTALVGVKATVTAKGDYPGRLALAVRSDKTRLDAPLDLGSSRWSLTAPAQWRTRLTPDDYALLVADPAAGRLTAPIDVALDVTEFAVPLVDGAADWTRLRAALDANVSSAALEVPQVGKVVIEKLVAALKTDRSTDAAQLTVKSPVNVAGTPGNLDAAVSMRSTADGPPYEIDATIADLPMPLVDHLAAMNGQATALVGPTATAKLKGTYPGALTMNVTSRSFQADVPVNIDGNRFVTLMRDVHVQLSLEGEATRTLLGKAHPIIADAVASEQPAKLTVRAEGFALPLGEFAFEKVKAQGVIDLGVVRMARRGWLQQGINGVAGMLGFRPRGEAETYLATFTPADFSIEQGRVRTSEMWLTSADMAIGFKGRADVAADRYEFDMGLMGATLAAQFPGLLDRVPASQVFTIPLSGSLNDPKPEWGRLSGALTSIAGSYVEGDAGRVLGAIGGLLNRGTGDTAINWQPPQAAQELAASMTPKPAPPVEPPAGESAPVDGMTSDGAAAGEVISAEEAAARARAEAEARAERQRQQSEQQRQEAEQRAAQQRQQNQQRRQEAEAREQQQRQQNQQRRQEAEQRNQQQQQQRQQNQRQRQQQQQQQDQPAQDAAAEPSSDAAPAPAE